MTQLAWKTETQHDWTGTGVDLDVCKADGAQSYRAEDTFPICRREIFFSKDTDCSGPFTHCLNITNNCRCDFFPPYF